MTCCLVQAAGPRISMVTPSVALTKLFESQTGQTYSQRCQQAVIRLALPGTATAHADTTWMTLTGECPARPYPAGPEVTYGYNKDGHPERKQLVAGVVTRSDGVPLAVDVWDGNADDPTWAHETLLGLRDRRQDLLFVANSKAVSHESGHDFCEAGVRHVSRLPNTFNLVFWPTRFVIGLTNDRGHSTSGFGGF